SVGPLEFYYEQDQATTYCPRSGIDVFGAAATTVNAGQGQHLCEYSPARQRHPEHLRHGLRSRRGVRHEVDITKADGTAIELYAENVGDSGEVRRPPGNPAIAAFPRTSGRVRARPRNDALPALN